MAPEEDGRGEKLHENPPNRVKFHEDVSGSDAHLHANPRERKRRACELDSAGNHSSKTAKQECKSRPTRPGALAGSQTLFLQNQRPLSNEVVQVEIVRRAACIAQPPLCALMGIRRIAAAEQAEIQNRATAMLGLLLQCGGISQS